MSRKDYAINNTPPDQPSGERGEMMKRTLNILEGLLELVDSWQNGEEWKIDDLERVEDLLREYKGKKVRITIEEID